jgi:glycosyltransferase involved in cell wall biosynthesis
VLLCNIDLASRSGTQMYVRDLALQLLNRGHLPVVYSPRLGEMAEEIRQATIPVTSDLDTLSRPPDLIHGHHHPQTMAALLHFPGVPGVFVCHDRLSWHSQPPRFPRLLRYVAVDANCLERLTCEAGIPAEQTRVLYNAVDLSRFRPRPPLPPRPRRALIFSAGKLHIPAVWEACRRAEIHLETMSARARQAPEEVLASYDLVFAKARCALEAMAVGCAVILCDQGGLGGMVRSDDYPRMRELNFGMRLLQAPLSPEAIARQIALYDPADAAAVSARVRAEAGLEDLGRQWEELYLEVLAEHRQAPPADPLEEFRAASRYLQQQMVLLPPEGAFTILRFGLGRLWTRLRWAWQRFRR